MLFLLSAGFLYATISQPLVAPTSSPSALVALNRYLTGLRLNLPDVTLPVPSTVWNQESNSGDGRLALSGVSCRDFDVTDFALRDHEGGRVTLNFHGLRASCNVTVQPQNVVWLDTSAATDAWLHLSLAGSLDLVFLNAEVWMQGIDVSGCDMQADLRMGCHNQPAAPSLCSIFDDPLIPNLLRLSASNITCTLLSDALRMPGGPLGQVLTEVNTTLSSLTKTNPGLHGAAEEGASDEQYLAALDANHSIEPLRPQGGFALFLGLITHTPSLITRAVRLLPSSWVGPNGNVLIPLNLPLVAKNGPWGGVNVTLLTSEILGPQNIESISRTTFGQYTRNYDLTMADSGVGTEVCVEWDVSTGKAINYRNSGGDWSEGGSTQYATTCVVVPLPGLRVRTTIVLAYNSERSCALKGPGMQPDLWTQSDSANSMAAMESLKLTRLTVTLDELAQRLGQRSWQPEFRGLGSAFDEAANEFLNVGVLALGQPFNVALGGGISELLLEQFNEAMRAQIAEAWQEQQPRAASGLCLSDSTTFGVNWGLASCSESDQYHQYRHSARGDGCVDFGSVGYSKGEIVSLITGGNWNQLPFVSYDPDGPNVAYHCTRAHPWSAAVCDLTYPADLVE